MARLIEQKKDVEWRHYEPNAGDVIEVNDTDDDSRFAIVTDAIEDDGTLGLFFPFRYGGTTDYDSVDIATKNGWKCATFTVGN